MKKRAKITIEFGGKKYRLSNSTRCESKRDCDLFKSGVCNESVRDVMFTDLPCAALHDAIFAECSAEMNSGFKEVKK